MRRKDREITDRAEVESIIKAADVCRIAIQADPAPYIVPMNFGYSWDDQLEFYFHCALDGRKLDLIAQNPNVGFALDTDHTLGTAEIPCDWGMKYRSIIGTGKISEITDPDLKKAGLERLIHHYGYTKENAAYDDEVFRKTKVLKLIVDKFCGKAKH